MYIVPPKMNLLYVQLPCVVVDFLTHASSVGYQVQNIEGLKLLVVCLISFNVDPSQAGLKLFKKPLIVLTCMDDLDSEELAVFDEAGIGLYKRCTGSVKAFSETKGIL